VAFIYLKYLIEHNDVLPYFLFNLNSIKMSKPKTYIKAIRITGDVIDIWEELKKHKIRSAEIFKFAGEEALRNKLTEFKIESKKINYPF
jgi:hypothetical protein